MKLIILLVITFSLFGVAKVQAQAQAVQDRGSEKFCKAVEKGRFNKIERMFKRQLKQRRNGTKYDNGPGSGMQITHQYNLDTLVLWFKSFPCVKDAAWDKYQIKIAIYPGGSTIGVKFFCGEEIKEYCFLIQEGTLGTINLFGWHPQLFKMKNKLVYKRMIENPGFVDRQHQQSPEYLRKGGW